MIVTFDYSESIYVEPKSHDTEEEKSEKRTREERGKGGEGEGEKEERGERRGQEVGVMTHKKLDVVRLMK